MEQRLSLVTLACQDVADARSFYERLGWKAHFHNEDVAFFQLPGLVFGLYARDALAQDLGVEPGRLSGSAITLAHNVGDRRTVARVLASAAAAGGKVIVEPEDTPWGGHSGYFRDPEGHLWEVAWNPAWTTRDGITRMD